MKMQPWTAFCAFLFSVGPKISSDIWRSEPPDMWCTIQAHIPSNLNFKRFHNFGGWKESLQECMAHSRDKWFLIYASPQVWAFSDSKILIKFIRNKIQTSMKRSSRSTYCSNKNAFITVLIFCCVNCLFFSPFTWIASLTDSKRILNSHSVYSCATGRAFMWYRWRIH